MNVLVAFTLCVNWVWCHKVQVTYNRKNNSNCITCPPWTDRKVMTSLSLGSACYTTLACTFKLIWIGESSLRYLRLTPTCPFPRWTAQQQSACPITMKQSCRDAAGRDSRKSTTWSKCSRPRFSSCRRSVCSLPLLVEVTHGGLGCANHNCACACISGGPASAQRGRADSLAGWIALQRLPPFSRRTHGGHPRGQEAY